MSPIFSITHGCYCLEINTYCCESVCSWSRRLNHISNILRCHSNVRHDEKTTKEVQQQEITSLNSLFERPPPASLYNSVSNICSKTWHTTLKSKQNNVFATRLQTSQSAHETSNLFRREKKHHEKKVISFGYLQALGVENGTLVNAGVQKL